MANRFLGLTLFLRDGMQSVFAPAFFGMGLWLGILGSVVLSPVAASPLQVSENESIRRPRPSPPVLNENVDVHWIGEDDSFAWYQAEREGGGSEIVVIDLKSGARLEPKDYPPGVPTPQPGSELASIALISLPRFDRTVQTGPETEIRFVNQTTKDVELVWVDQDARPRSYGTIPPGESRSQHTFVGHLWLLRDRNRNPLAAIKCEVKGPATFTLTSETERPLADEEPGRVEASVDSTTWPRAFVRDYNVWVHQNKDAAPVQVTDDGTEKNDYTGRIIWAPDRKHFCLFRTERAELRKVFVVDSTPDDQLQPKLVEFGYAKPGDALDHPRLSVFSADGAQAMIVDDELAPNPFEVRDVQWRDDSQSVRFVYNERGHQRLRVIEMDVISGRSRIMLDEVSQTFIDYAGKYFLSFIDSSNELIWMSERDGWNHLYLIDQATGEVKRQLTKGAWAVREVVEVDLASRTLLVAAGGIHEGEDPYHQHLLRVSLDGAPPVTLTNGDGEHQWRISPSKRFFVDRWSRVDLPPVTAIRSLETGNKIADMEVADASNLLSSGWTMPKRFTARGRDGETDIYGLVVFPNGFDVDKKYPVLELIYAGPHAAHVPKSFQRLGDLHEAANGIGDKQFIIVRIDGMGTSFRSKSFHDICWKNLGDAGFPDRIAWMNAAAEVIPQMDLKRVGVWGGSAGGQNAMRALIAHGDFYKAAVADCGCHDNRMDKIWWNELWMGWPVGPHYEEQSNVTQAHRMNGKLMLSVGELDTNVDPASTMQVVDALIRANKDFDLLFFPGSGHGIGSGAYGTRRRIDFFARAFYESASQP